MTSKPVSFRVFDLRLFGLLSEFGVLSKSHSVKMRIRVAVSLESA